MQLDHHNILVDDIYYFEDLNNEWDKICQKIGINEKLVHLYNTNSSKTDIFDIIYPMF